MREKSPTRLAAEKLCDKYPDTPSRTLARRLAASHGITIDAARQFIRRTRGTNGVLSRKMATSPTVPGKAGWTPELPPTQAVPWSEFPLGSGINVAVLSDLHVPYHSPTAVSSAVKYCKKRKPDVLLLNGDLADFYSISRHEKNPAKRDLLQEVETVRATIEWLRYEFGKKCRIVLKLGNHEERWQKWLWNAAPEICDSPRMNVSEWVEAEKYGVEVVGDQRPVMVGKLPVLHGHELPRGISSPVNPARGAFLRTHHTILVGHSHQTSGHADTDLFHSETFCWSQGCLCDMTPEYARVNRWNHGFAFVEVDSSGDFNVSNFRISDGVVRSS